MKITMIQGIEEETVINPIGRTFLSRKAGLENSGTNELQKGE